MFRRLDAKGSADFIPDFNENFPGAVETYRAMHMAEEKISGGVLLSQISVKKI